MDALTLRSELVRVSSVWHQRFQAGLARDDSSANPGDAMASSYAYVLAAVLKMVEEAHGLEAADELAQQANELLENGDFDDWNADVTPGPSAPS